MADRNINIPLYLAIRKYGSILNVNEYSEVYIPRKWPIADEVLTRLFRIYKVPCYRMIDILVKACRKYQCSIPFMEKKYSYIINYGIGLVLVKNGMITATQSHLVRYKTRKFLSKRKLLPSGVDLDLLHMKTEIKFLPQQIKYDIKWSE